MLAPQPDFFRNLRDLPDSISASAVVAGFINVLVSYSGPLIFILQAAQAGNLSVEQTSSWVWAIAVGCGVLTILLSLYYRQPITAPWSTAGAVLLATSLTVIPLQQAIGAYIVASLIVMLIGFSGWFARAMALVPQPIVMGLLGGILLRFGIDMFTKLQDDSSRFMVLAMMAIFFVLKRRNFRAPTLVVLVVGTLIAALNGQLHFENVSLSLTTPIFTMPEFVPSTFLSLSLPLVALALTSQYAPGQAVLRAGGYEAPINGILVAMGFGSIVIAPFGGHGLNLGALLAAFVTNPDAHPDPNKRYSAGVAVGVFYVLVGMFGATIVSFFQSLPQPLVATIAGLAIMGTITSSVTSAVKEPETRDGAMIAFLCSAASFTMFSVGAPFWGLVGGIAVNALMNYRKHESQTAEEVVSSR